MGRYPIEIQRIQTERMVYCRGCSREIESEEELIRTYSFRATGIYLHFCLDCAKQIGELAK